MPIVRKMIEVGKTSRGVILPKSWIEYAEQKEGKQVTAIEMEVDGCLILKPIFEKDAKDGVPSRQAERTNLANHLTKEAVANV